MPSRRTTFWIIPAALALACASVASPARGDMVLTGSFGPGGDIGFNPSVTAAVSFGPTGAGNLFQLDGFLNASNANLNNGSGFGTSAQLSYGPIAGVGFNFAFSQPTTHQLLLTYTFVNNTGGALTGLQFMSFADADVDPANFTNEYATVSGSPGPGSPNTTPHSYQIDDPTFGTIITNLTNGTLDNTNHSGIGQPINVSMALGFLFGTVANGATVQAQVLLSDDLTTLPGLSLTQQNVDSTGSPGSFTMSGRTVSVPEPASVTLLAMGGISVCLAVRRSRRTRQTS
jgi:hypothetical protein